ncbi:MAG: YggS family pyridoxal phosphate-dependent enzyme [Pseudomonadota bacterium]
MNEAPADLKVEEDGLRERLTEVQSSIADALREAGRASDAATLVAASKTVDVDRLQQAINMGLRVFGENRVQEAKSKWPELRERNPDIELHMIGSLQSNKAREAVALCDVIQSVDRRSLAKALAKECERQDRRPSIFIQVNTGDEPQKGGVDKAEVDGFIRACREDYDLNLIGLMCIPPEGQDPMQDFITLRDLAERNGVKELSMGMSSDYAKAISAGATFVRVGSRIFGSRPPLKAHAA